MTAAVLKVGKVMKVFDWNSRILCVVSRTEISDRSAVSLSMAMNSLPSGGITILIA